MSNLKTFEFLVKDDFFSPEELELIWCELKLLNQSPLMKGPAETGSALNQQGSVLKRNSGVFLKEVYLNTWASPFARYSQKVFNGLTREFADLGFANRAVLGTSTSDFLLSYYENGDEYLPHFDYSVTTALFWFFQEPKKFEGGNLYFPELDEIVEVKNNRMVMFPSQALHSVTPVVFEGIPGQHQGRFCFTLFLNS